MFLRTAIANSSCFHHTAAIKTLYISSILIVYSRVFRAVVIDKTQCESEERLVALLPGVCQLIVGTHWLAAVAVSGTQLPETVLQQK